MRLYLDWGASTYSWLMPPTSRAELVKIKQQVQYLISTQQYQPALALCSGLIKQSPEDAEAWFLLGGLRNQVGDLAGAEIATRNAVALAPENPQALFNLAVLLKHTKRLEEALAVLRKLAKHSPHNPLVQLEMGTALSSLNRHEEAIECLQHTAESNPDDPSCRVALASAHWQAGNRGTAMELLHHTVRLAPGHALAWKELGRAQFHDGDFVAAKESLERACLLQPQDADSHFLLGTTCAALPDSQSEALRSLQKTLEINPQAINAYRLIASIGTSSGNPQLACQALEKILLIRPDDTEVLYELANARQAAGDIQQAVVEYRKLLAITPAHNAGRAGLAYALLISGDRSSAREILLPLLDEPDTDPRIHYVYAKTVINDQDAEQCISRIECALNRGIENHGIRLKLHFALGDLHDRLTDYDRAIDNYHKANRLAEARFDNDRHLRYIDGILKDYHQDAIHLLPRADNISHTPVFIVGMPRSGTSLVEQILSQHNEIYAAGELEDMNQIARHISAGSIHDAQLLNEHARNYLEKTNKLSANCRYVTDKMPTNFHYLGLIYQLFPGARVIHCCRDALDTTLSCYFQAFSGQLDFAYDLESLGQYYRQYARLMLHWYKHLKYPIHRIQYEALVANPEKEVGQLLDFLNLQWDDACMRFFESKRITSTASFDQVRRPIYSDSVHRWKNYRRHLQPLIDTLGDDVRPDACKSYAPPGSH